MSPINKSYIIDCFLLNYIDCCSDTIHRHQFSSLSQRIFSITHPILNSLENIFNRCRCQHGFSCKLRITCSNQFTFLSQRISSITQSIFNSCGRRFSSKEVPSSGEEIQSISSDSKGLDCTSNTSSSSSKTEINKKLDLSASSPSDILKLLEYGEELPSEVIDTIPFDKFTKIQILRFISQNIIQTKKCCNRNISEMSHYQFRSLLISVKANEETDLVQELFFNFLTDDKKKLIIAYFKALCEKDRIHTPAFQPHLRLFITHAHLMTAEQYRFFIEKVNFSLTNYLSYLSMDQISFAIYAGKEIEFNDPSIIHEVIHKVSHVSLIPSRIIERLNLAVTDHRTIVALLEKLSPIQKRNLNLANWPFFEICRLYMKCGQLPEASATIDLTKWTIEQICDFADLSGAKENLKYINCTNWSETFFHNLCNHLSFKMNLNSFNLLSINREKWGFGHLSYYQEIEPSLITLVDFKINLRFIPARVINRLSIDYFKEISFDTLPEHVIHSLIINLSPEKRNYINEKTIATNVEKINENCLKHLNLLQIQSIDFRRLSFIQLLTIVNTFPNEHLKEQLGRVNLEFLTSHEILQISKCIPFFINVAPYLTKISMWFYGRISIEECHHIDYFDLSLEQRAFFTISQKRAMRNAPIEREEFKSSSSSQRESSAISQSKIHLDAFAKKHSSWSSFKSNLESVLKIIRISPTSPKPDSEIYNQLRNLILRKGNELMISDLFDDLERDKISKRFKEISLVTHPDKNPGEEPAAIFKLCSEAYNIVNGYVSKS